MGTADHVLNGAIGGLTTLGLIGLETETEVVSA